MRDQILTAVSVVISQLSPVIYTLGVEITRFRANVSIVLPPLEALRTVLVILTGDRAPGVLYEGLLTPRWWRQSQWSWTGSSCQGKVTISDGIAPRTTTSTTL